MTNKRTTKRALLFSVLSMLLCVSMLMGTTFAWFTDSVSSVNNIIKSGNLDIELYYQVEGQTDWTKVGDNTNIFTDSLWEPGHTEVVKLKVVNEGTLALKYQLGVNIYSETGSVNVYGKEFKLSDYIKYGVVAGEQDYTRDAAVAAVDATATKLNVTYGTDGNLLAGKEAVMTMVVYMPTTVDNNANYAKGEAVPEIKLGLNLFATQYTFEEDSFGIDYDKDAVYADETYVIEGNATLADTLATIETSDDETVLIELDTDVEWVTGGGHGSTPWLSANAGVKTLIVDGNGHTITATGAGVGSIRLANGGTLVIKNATIIDKSVSYAESAWEFTYLEFAGKLEFDNVTFLGGIQLDTDNGQAPETAATFTNCTFKTEEDSVYAVWFGNGSATFENCTFTGTRGLKIHEAYGTEVETVIVDKCIFGPLSKKPGVAIGTVNAATSITIKNSTFADTQVGDQGNRKYETDTDVKTFNFVEEGNNVSTYENVNSEAELVTKLQDAGAAGSGNTVIKINADLDMSTVNWTPITVDGYHGADIVTIDGQGHTITGLTAPLFAGGFAGGSGIVIKNLTIADSDIVSKNTLGSGAFIESVDSMAVITLTNCHLKSSTVTGGAGSRTGGLIGWTAGYSNVNDGPVKTYVTISDCSVIDCTITCDGSVGGIYGHAGNNDWTYSTVENCIVKDCKLNSTDDGGWRVGVVVGTANVGELTISGITSSGNTLTQTGKTAPAGQSDLYGRFVPGSTGKLTIDGVDINKA